MYKGGSRLLPIILAIIVIAVAVFAVVAVGRALLNRNQEEVDPIDSSASRSLLTTDADRAVRMTVRGPITADEEFHSYQIEISPIGRRMATYSGYQERVIEDERYSSSTTAYVEFVHALSRAEFTREASLSDEQDDTRGACADGRLYTFEIMQAQSVDKSLWTTSCRDLPGSFAGDAPEARRLFLGQIPDSNALLRDIRLR